MRAERKYRSAHALVRYIDDDIPREQLDRLARIARNRVLPHLKNLDMVENNLMNFAVNCYMQGFYDTVESKVLTDKPAEPETPLDFQI